MHWVHLEMYIHNLSPPCGNHAAESRVCICIALPLYALFKVSFKESTYVFYVNMKLILRNQKEIIISADFL